MDWMRVYLIEMAELETRWMEIMESQNGKKGQGQLTPSGTTDQAGYGDSSPSSPSSGGRLGSLDSETE